MRFGLLCLHGSHPPDTLHPVSSPFTMLTTHGWSADWQPNRISLMNRHHGVGREMRWRGGEIRRAGVKYEEDRETEGEIKMEKAGGKSNRQPLCLQGSSPPPDSPYMGDQWTGNPPGSQGQYVNRHYWTGWGS